MDNKIYSTTNYAMFKSMSGNRQDADKRATKIIASIKEHGQLQPIIVNRNMEVIDGQARLCALTALHLPVQYIVREYDVSDVIAINTTAKSWRSIDYVKSFAEQGNVDYAYLNSLIQEFGELGVAPIYTASSNSYAMTSSALGLSKGTFKMDSQRYHQAREELLYIRRCMPYIKHMRGRLLNYQAALIFCFRTPEIDNERMIEQLMKNPDLIRPAANVLTATENLEAAYNRNAKYWNRVYISTLYKDRQSRMFDRGKHNAEN